MSNVRTVHCPDGVGTVHVIDHPSAPVEVWRDDTAAPVVALDVSFPGREVGHDPVFIPVEVAREVAAAILETIPDEV